MWKSPHGPTRPGLRDSTARRGPTYTVPSAGWDSAALHPLELQHAATIPSLDHRRKFRDVPCFLTAGLRDDYSARRSSRIGEMLVTRLRPQFWVPEFRLPRHRA